jgi:predicted enzyme related to lactoylglutathione lyase
MKKAGSGALGGRTGRCPRGENKDRPAHGLVYLTVATLRASLKKCAAKGGAVVGAVRTMGGANRAVLRDPAGAVAMLFEPAKDRPAK